MRKITLFFMLSFIVRCASAQFFNESMVPIGIKQEFSQQFPKAKKINWSRGSLGYEVTFVKHHHKHFALYGHDGAVIVQTIELSKSRLPRSARKELRDNYGEYMFKSAESIRDHDGMVYAAQIAGGKKDLALVFDQEGRLRKVTPIDPTLAKGSDN